MTVKLPNGIIITQKDCGDRIEAIEKLMSDLRGGFYWGESNLGTESSPNGDDFDYWSEVWGNLGKTLKMYENALRCAVLEEEEPMPYWTTNGADEGLDGLEIKRIVATYEDGSKLDINPATLIYGETE